MAQQRTDDSEAVSSPGTEPNCVVPGHDNRSLPDVRIKELLESQALMAAIIESAMDAIITIDEEQQVLVFNNAAEKMFQCPAAEALGRSLDRFIPKRFQADHPSHIRSFGETGVKTRAISGSRPVFGLRANGQEFPVEASISQVEAGGQKLYTVIMRDITERVRAAERFQQLIERAPNGMVMVDREGKIVLVNAQVENSFGYSRDELLAQPIEMLVPQRFHGQHAAYRDDFISCPTARPMGVGRDLFGRRKDGSEFPVEIGLNPFETDQGLMVVGTIVDITERQQAETALRTSEGRYRTLFECAADGIVIADQEGYYLDANASICAMLGYARDEMIGLHSSDIVCPTEAQHIEVALGLIKAKSEYYREWRFRRRNGEVFSAEVIATLMPDGNLLGVIRDVTARKQAEEEVRDLNENLERVVTDRTAQLRAVNRELEAFSYSVSHDLRAPLRHINGFSQALLEDYADKLDETGKSYLQEVRAASQEMAQLIDDVLQLARVTRSEMHTEVVNLSELAHSVLAGLLNRDPGRTVVVDIDEVLTTRGDKRLLRIMLVNLLGNAWKFTARKDEAKIRFGQVQKEDELVYFVSDNGAGFDMAYVDKLFGAFQRLHTAAEFEGTGIGLATIQRIVHRHGGRVWAEGAVNQGAKFYFTLANFEEVGNEEQSDLTG